MAADANLRRGYPSARVFIAVLHVARSSFSLVRRLNVRVVGMRCSRWPGCPRVISLDTDGVLSDFRVWGENVWKRETKLGFFSSFEVTMLSERACRTKTKGAGRTTGLLLKQALRSKPGNNSRLALHVANAMLLKRKACQLR